MGSKLSRAQPLGENKPVTPPNMEEKKAGSPPQKLNPTQIIGRYAVMMGEIGATNMFMEWKLFDKIPDKGSISFKELADSINADESLVARLGGMLVSVGRLTHAGPGLVSHSDTSPMFKSDHPAGNLFRVMFDHGLRGYTQWPDYFAAYGNKEPTLITQNPFTFSWGHPDKTVWEVLDMDENRSRVFAAGMKSANTISAAHGGPTAVYDFTWLSQEAQSSTKTDRALIVDVGGNHGHTLKHILENVAGIPAERCVLQDLPEVIEKAQLIQDPIISKIQKIGHNFNEPQPVKGAMTYLLRRVLHDYGDEACIKILTRLAEALDPAEPRSRVLIMDQVVAEPPSPRSASADMIMLNIGGKERTPSNFDLIAEGAGLKVVKIHTIPGTEVGVVECAKA